MFFIAFGATNLTFRPVPRGDADFVIFVAAYNILDCSGPSMPPGCPADLNGDGVVDDGDFIVFVPAYNELVCP
ncbi:MAG: hypothetical protein KF805_08030 [Phycisphaeraceae bacterium]|nr:hypothetical protein [Phycisphaeraceae bacterium]